MRTKLLLIVAVVLGLTLIVVSGYGTQTGSIYKSNSIVPEYYVEKDYSGEIRIYDVDQVVIPKLILRPTKDGFKAYEPGKPLIPLFEIKGSNAIGQGVTR